MAENRGVDNESGLTLVEVLASLVILGIVIVSFLTIFGQSALYNENTEKVVKNTSYAEYLMELFVSYSHKGSTLESVENLLIEDESFQKKSDNTYSILTSEGKIEVRFILENGVPDYKVTRVVISTFSNQNVNSNSVIESLLYWRNHNEKVY